jgi:hypothetical protein
LLPAGESMDDPQSFRGSQVTDEPQEGGPAAYRGLTGGGVIDADDLASQRFPLILQQSHQHFSFAAKRSGRFLIGHVGYCPTPRSIACLTWAHMSTPVPRRETSDAPRNECGVASVLLGLVALITCWLMIGIPFGIAAVITGDIGRGRVKRGEANNPRAAMAGIVLGAVAIVAGLVAIGYYASLDADMPDHH